MVSGITITQAALHAALRRARDDGGYAGLDVLLALLDPAHQSTEHAVGGGAAWATKLDAARLAEPCYDEAGTPAPPIIELHEAPGVGTPPATTASADTGQDAAGVPVNPPPAQAAVGRRDRRLRATPADDALLRELWPQAIPFREMMRQFNERASSPVKSDVRLRERATRLGLPTQRQQAMVAAGNAPAGRGMVKGVWTPERDALLAARYPREGVRPEVLEALNALPGPPIESPNALKARAHRLNLRLDPEGRKRIGAELAAKARAGLAAKRAERSAAIAGMRAERESAAEIEATKPPADAVDLRTARASAHATSKGATLPAVQDEKADVFDAFAAGQTVRDVHADFGLPLSTLANWHAEWKLAQKGVGA